MATKRIKRDAGTAWLEKTNPLKGLSISEAQAIFDNARQGDTQRLHWIFQEIESANPTLMTCVERRVSALAGINWGVTVRPRADQSLGEEQQAAVEGFISTIENFDEMIEHLDIAFFRGFSYAQPLWEADGGVRHISLLDSWCFLTKDGRLFYNPVCDGFTRNCEEVTREAGLIGIRRRRWIDYPALSIHIRNAVGERDWGRFLERIALPKPAVIMGPNPTPEQRNDYVAVAEDVEDGKVSVWPYGTSLTDFMGGSRGQDPFSAFIRHQDEKIVLLSTGGTLTSLAQADTGALAGGAQMDVWREIVAKDAKAIEGSVMRALVLPFLERKFPGRPCAIDFTFDRTKKLTAKESAEVAVALKNAGYLVVQSELEAATGFTLEKAPEPPAQPMPGLAMAKAKEDEPQAPRKALADTLQDALEAAMVEAIAGELKTAKAKKDENGQEHDEKGLFTGDGQGGDGSGKDEGKSGTDKAQQPEFIGTPYKDSADFRKQASEVTQAQISEVVAGTSSKKIPAHVGLRVVMENPEITDGAGHKVRFLEQIVPKYESGYGRSGRQPDIKRFEHVGAAIHAVKQDKGTVLKFRGRTIPNMIDPPSGTQRIYQTPTDGGITWVFTYANEKKIRSIQERDKNNPPYDTRKKRRR